MRLSIVIPCFNEEENIPLLFRRFDKILQSRDDVEVVFVNNGSTDGSAKVFADLIPRHPFARLVNVDKNQGYGYGILSGLRVSNGDFIGWTHADLQTDPADVLKAWNIITNEENPQNVFVKGLRKGRNLFDLVFTIGMSFFETLYLKRRLWDINAQPNIFSKSFFEKWGEPPHDFSLDLYAMYMAKREKQKIVRIPVFFPKRLHGTSKWNTSFRAKWKFIKRTLLFSVKLKKEGLR